MKLAHLVARLFAGLTLLFGLLAGATVIGAATPGSPSLTVYFAKDFTDTPYQKAAFQKVASAWALPSKTPAPGSKAVVVATLSRDGKLVSANLGMKSGIDAWDQAAVAALQKAAPFAPFPAAYRNATTEVHFHFEWTAKPPTR